MPELNIAIEISGNYYHDALNDHLNGMTIDQVKSKYKNDNFQIERFEKDIFKMNYLKNSKWNVYYITEDEIINCDFIEKINKIIKGDNNEIN